MVSVYTERKRMRPEFPDMGGSKKNAGTVFTITMWKAVWYFYAAPLLSLHYFRFLPDIFYLWCSTVVRCSPKLFRSFFQRNSFPFSIRTLPLGYGNVYPFFYAADSSNMIFSVVSASGISLVFKLLRSLCPPGKATQYLRVFRISRLPLRRVSADSVTPSCFLPTLLRTIPFAATGRPSQNTITHLHGNCF